MADTETTSALEDRLRPDIKDAPRARDHQRQDTRRVTTDDLHNEEIARTDKAHKLHGQALTEEDRYALIEKQIKQRNEAAQLYRQGGRPELAEKEEREAEILKAYQPAQLGDDEIRALVAGLVASHGKEFRAIMPLAAKETKGRADGKRVSEIVREMTA